MNIEELVKRFVTLAAKDGLTKAELEEAKELMRQLKKSGMANQEISKLSKGKWTASTVKFYTPGVKPAHPSPWEDAVDMLDKVIAAGLSLDDVDTTVELADELQSAGINLSQVINLLLTADSSSINVADLVHQYELLKEYGLSPEKVSETLSLKVNLENMGVGLDSLAPVVELAKNHGEPGKILQAISQYKKLVDLDHETEVTKEKLDNLGETLAGIQEQVKATKATLSQLKEPVDALDKVKQLGFGVVELNKLSDLAQKYGNVKKLLDAVNAYDTYSDIQGKVNKAKADLATLKANIEILQTEHAHIKTGITMCLTLINEYNYGLDAISTILSAAGKYGDPITVLKAVDSYGQLEVILQEIDKQQGIISANKKEIARLDGRHEDALKKLESLNALALKVGSEVGRVQGEMSASDFLKKLLMLINEPYSAEYGDHINVALLVTLALKKWVSKNETKFQNYYSIKSGLESLFKELGGLA